MTGLNKSLRYKETIKGPLGMNLPKGPLIILEAIDAAKDWIGYMKKNEIIPIKVFNID